MRPTPQRRQCCSPAVPTADLPRIDPPADDIVRLPGGLVQQKWPEPPVLLAREAQVRELTGADEEAIYKARATPCGS
jgi:hypothetical protein